MEESFELNLCKSVSGFCVILNGFRIAGGKPTFTPNNIIAKWQVSKDDLERALDLKLTP